MPNPIKFDCPFCHSKSSMKRIDTRGLNSEIHRLYECQICKERAMSKEQLIKKCNSLEMNNRKYKK